MAVVSIHVFAVKEESYQTNKRFSQLKMSKVCHLSIFVKFLDFPILDLMPVNVFTIKYIVSKLS